MQRIASTPEAAIVIPQLPCICKLGIFIQDISQAGKALGFDPSISVVRVHDTLPIYIESFNLRRITD